MQASACSPCSSSSPRYRRPRARRWRRSASSGAEAAPGRMGRDAVKAILVAVLAAVLVGLAAPHAASAATDDTEPKITSWMLPPDTRPVWGLLDPDRAQGSGPALQHADSLTGNWGGYRDRLSDEHGLSVVGNYTSECAGNPVGGRSRGVIYTHNI